MGSGYHRHRQRQGVGLSDNSCQSSCVLAEISFCFRRAESSRTYCSSNMMFISRRVRLAFSTRLDPSVCLLCQWRSFSFSYRRYAEKEAPVASPPPPSPLDEAPRAHGRAVSDFTPRPLNRPIGLSDRPRAGENTGIDMRTLRQRRDDFVDYDKHIARRKQL